MAYMTRDKDDEGMIAFWNSDKSLQSHTTELCCKQWYSNKMKVICEIVPKDFKKIFPKHKLPKKGSIKWVELRLYIPGEG